MPVIGDTYNRAHSCENGCGFSHSSHDLRSSRSTNGGCGRSRGSLLCTNKNLEMVRLAEIETYLC